MMPDTRYDTSSKQSTEEQLRQQLDYERTVRINTLKEKSKKWLIREIIRLRNGLSDVGHESTSQSVKAIVNELLRD